MKVKRKNTIRMKIWADPKRGNKLMKNDWAQLSESKFSETTMNTSFGTIFLKNIYKTFRRYKCSFFTTIIIKILYTLKEIQTQEHS